LESNSQEKEQPVEEVERPTLRWWRELHLWRYHMAKVLHVLEHGGHLLIVGLFHRI
jgi:hypothetical protein